MGSSICAFGRCFRPTRGRTLFVVRCSARLIEPFVQQVLVFLLHMTRSPRFDWNRTFDLWFYIAPIKGYHLKLLCPSGRTTQSYFETSIPPTALLCRPSLQSLYGLVSEWRGLRSGIYSYWLPSRKWQSADFCLVKLEISSYKGC